MIRPKRSFYDRAMEALRDRYPKDATQRHLAALAGVKQPSVNDWKEGFPKVETAVQLAESLGVCVEWLMTERGPKWVPKPQGDDAPSGWSTLGPDQRAEVERFTTFVRTKKPD